MKIQYQEVNGSYGNMIDELNSLGADGWDVVSLMIRTDANTFRAVMKRAVKK